MGQAYRRGTQCMEAERIRSRKKVLVFGTEHHTIKICEQNAARRPLASFSLRWGDSWNDGGHIFSSSTCICASCQSCLPLFFSFSFGCTLVRLHAMQSHRHAIRCTTLVQTVSVLPSTVLQELIFTSSLSGVVTPCS